MHACVGIYAHEWVGDSCEWFAPSSSSYGHVARTPAVVIVSGTTLYIYVDSEALKMMTGRVGPLRFVRALFRCFSLFSTLGAIRQSAETRDSWRTTRVTSRSCSKSPTAALCTIIMAQCRYHMRVFTCGIIQNYHSKHTDMR